MQITPREKRLRSIAHTAIGIEDALALAAANAIVLAEDEKRDIQDAIARREFMASPAAEVYYGSNGGKTKSFCSKLDKQGPLGRIAAALFRAQKASSRAKVYRGGVKCDGGFRLSYRDLAYDRKDEVVNTLSEILAADACGLTWGWKLDEKNPSAPNVIYVNLPQGQVSFHSVQRHRGPDYHGDWDGEGKSEQRILAFCNSLMAEPVVSNNES